MDNRIPMGWGYTEDDLDPPVEIQFDVIMYLAVYGEQTLDALGTQFGFHPLDYEWLKGKIIRPLLKSNVIRYNRGSHKYSLAV